MCPFFILVSRRRDDFDRPEMQPHGKMETKSRKLGKKDVRLKC